MIRSSYHIVTAPEECTITLIEAKKQLRMEDDTIDDTLITALMKAADQIAENKTSRAFMQSTYEYSADYWEYAGEIKLWPAPLVSVTSVQYYNSANALTTMVADTDYHVDTKSIPGRIILKSTPSLYDRPDAIKIIYKVGYGVAASTASEQRALVPESVKSWVKLNMTTMYEHRQLFTNGSMGNIYTFSDSLIYPYIL